MRKPSTNTIALLYVFLLVGMSAIAMLSATPNPNDDYYPFQLFIETLANGTLDLSIPGFHGMNILTVPWYLMTRSSLAQIEFQMIAGVFLPLFAYLAAKHLFRSVWHGVVFASIIALMPFLSFGSLRGWMVAIYNCLLFLTIFGATKGARWTWIPWGFSIISLPFSVALFPLLVYLTPSSVHPWWIRYRHLAYGLAIPAVYVAVQYMQVGQINVGVHEEMNHLNIWQGPERIFLNLAHAVQMMFSVHNYYFVDPGKTGHGNMMHTTPILVFLAILALSNPKDFFRDRGLPFVLLLGAIIGIGLNAMLDHMDDFYMQTGVFFLIFAALPVLKKHQLWIPVVLGTLYFQWFYFYLQHGEAFTLTPIFFIVPVFVTISFLVWVTFHWKDAYTQIRSSWL